MSRTIDEKVVEMRFDNQDFEKNVSQSMSTLDKLKHALDFSGAEKSFDGISSAIDKVQFGGMSDALDTVGEKFTALEGIALGALANIGAKLSDLAIDTVKSLSVDQFTAGFDKYAEKTKSVQTIMNMTGKEIDEVEKELDKLMWYADETSYSFTDMTSNAALFAAQGVDLETAVTAMQGISNWAGLLGASKQQASRVMFNLSQALSSGYIRQIDWKSVMTANMADEKFRQLAIDIAEAQGTLARFSDDDAIAEWVAELQEAGRDISADEIKKFADDYLNGMLDVNAAIQATGLSMDDLLDKLSTGLVYLAAVDSEGNEILKNEKEGEKMIVNANTFAETLTKGKWFTNDVLLETLQHYGEYTGQLYEWYTKLQESGYDVTTSELIGFVNDFSNGSLDIQEAMEATGMDAEELTELLKELSQEEYDLGRQALEASQMAITFKDAIDATKDAVSSQWLKTFQILFGNYEEAKVLWTDLANELWDIFAGPLEAMNEMLSSWREDFGGHDALIQGFKNLYFAVRSYIDPITEMWNDVFPPMTAERLADITKGIEAFTENLILSDEQAEQLATGFRGLFDIIKFVGDIIGQLVTSFFPALKEGLGDSTTTLFDMIEQFGEWGSSLPETLKNTELFAKGLTDVSNALAYLGRFLGTAFSLTRIVEAYNEAGGGLAGVINIFRDNLTIGVEFIFDAFKNLTGIDITRWKDKVVLAFDAVTEAVLRFADFIARSFGWEENPFKEVLDTSSGALEQLKITFAGFSGIDLSGFTSFYDAIIDKLGPLGAIFDGFKNMFAGVWDFLQKTAPVIGNVLSWIGDVISKLGDVIIKYFGNLTLGDIFNAIEAGGVVALVVRLGWVFDGLAEGLEALSRKVKVDIIRSLAMSIIMLAGAALMISQIDADKMGGTMGILGESMAGMIGGLLGAMKLSAGANPKSLLTLPTLVTGIGFAMIEMAAAIMLLVKPIKEFAEMERSGLLQGFAAVGGALASFLAASWLSPVTAVTKASALKLIAESLIILTGAIKLITMLKLETFESGLKRIAAAIGTLLGSLSGVHLITSLFDALGGFSSFSPETMGAALFTVAKAMIALAAAMWLFDKFEWGTVLSGLGKMAVSLVVLAAVSTVLVPFLSVMDHFSEMLMKFGKGILFLSLGLAVVGLISKVLGDSAETLVEDAFNLLTYILQQLSIRATELSTYVVEILLQFASVVAQYAPELSRAILDILVGVISEVGKAFSEMDFTAFFDGAKIIGGLLVAIFLLKKMALTPKDFARMIASIAGVGLIIAEIFALVWAIGKANEEMNLMPGLQSFAAMADVLGDMFFSKFGILVAGIAGLLALFDKFNLGAASAGAFASVVTMIGEVSLVIEAMGVIFSTLGGLISGIDWIVAKLGGPENGVVLAIQKFGEIVEAIADLIGGAIGHLVGSIVGGVAGETIEQVMKSYTDGLAYMADKGAPFFNMVNGLGQGTLEGCKAFGDMILTLTGASILEGLTSWVKGKVSYKEFAEKLADMGPDLKTFAESMTGITQAQVDAAVGCAKIIEAFTDVVPRQGGLYQLIVGNQNLGIFGSQLYLFGYHLSKFQEKAKDFNEDVLNKAAACAEIVMDFASRVPKSGATLLKWIVGEQNLETFGLQLAAFGGNLYKFSISAAMINKDAIIGTGAVVESLVSTADKIEDVALGGLFSSETSMTEFGKQLISFGDSFSKYAEKVAQINQYKVSGVAQAISDTIDAFADSDDAGLISKIKNIGNKVLNGIADMFMTDDAKKKTQTAAGQLLQYISDKFLEDTSVALMSVKITELITKAFGDEGLSEGLKQAALGLIQQIQNGMSEGLAAEDGPVVAFRQFLTELETELGKNDRMKIFYDNGLRLLNSFKNGLTYETNTATVIAKLKELLETLAGEIVSQENLNRFNAGGKALIGQVIAGMSGADVQQQVRETSGNITAGVAEGMTSNEALAKVQQAAKKVVNTGALQPMKQEAQIRSPSELFKELIGKNITLGVAEGMFDAVPELKEKASQVLDIVIDSIDDLDFVQKLKKSGINIIDMFGGSILNGSSIDYLNEIGMEVPGNLLTSMNGVINEGGFYETGEMALFNLSEGVEGYLPTVYDEGYDTIFTLADGMVDAASEAQPYLVSAAEQMGDAFSEPVVERVKGALGYVEYMMKEMPDGSAVKTVVHDFESMKMEHDELEAYLYAFRNATKEEQDKMIRQMGADYHNDTLADYMRSMQLDSTTPNHIKDQSWQNMAAEIAQQTAEISSLHEENRAYREESWITDGDGNVLSYNEAAWIELKKLNDNVNELNDNMQNQQIVLDSGELVGATTPKYDRSFGNKTILSRRGI